MKIIKISRKDLLELYSTLKIKEICHILKISHPTLNRLLKRADIPLRGMGNRWPRPKYQLVS